LEVLPGVVQDLGFIRQATAKELIFELRNRTDHPIRILDVATTCSCTTSGVSKAAIDPDHSSRLTLTYNSGHARGEIDVHALVVYQKQGDPAHHSLALAARGEIDPDIGLSAERLVFHENVAATKSLKLWARYGDELKIERVTCDKRFFKVRLLAGTESGRHTLEVAFQPTDYYPDAGPPHVVIQSNSPRQPVLMIPMEVVDSNSFHAR
jgi:hypothetical protein